MLLSSLLACVGPDKDEPAPAAEATPFACELGTDGPDGFVTLADAGALELHMGFQGFLLFVLRVRAGDDRPAEADATVGVTFDGVDPVSVSQPRVPFGDDGVTDEILVFLTSNYASYYEGRHAEVGLRLATNDAVCTASGEATMIDEDPCIHTGDEPLCPEEDTGP
jgi:hypothetical protein